MCQHKTRIRLFSFLGYLAIGSILLFVLFQKSPHSIYAALKNIFNADIQPIPDKSIFFLETSKIRPIESTTNNDINLNARQACAIESAALHNPSLSIYCVFVSSDSKLVLKAYNPYIRAIISYSNVHLRETNLWSYAAHTTVYDWLGQGSLFRSKYLTSHSSDLLRMLTLWRYGGTYLDLDTITLQSLENLTLNYFGRDGNDINSGVLSADLHGSGHELVTEFLNEFQSNFDGNAWSHNGPSLVKRVLIRKCAIQDLNQLWQNGCHGFRIYPQKAFYPIVWKKWQDFFDPNTMNSTLKELQETYVVHFWNKFSKIGRIEKAENPNNAYAQLAKLHCPRVYDSIKENYF